MFLKQILLTGLALMFGAQVFAYNYDENSKKAFYDSYINSMFYSLQSSLLSQGYNKNNVNTYINVMRQRLDRKSFENSTWACVEKYSYQQLIGDGKAVSDDCFSRWSKAFFFEDNQDALKYLK